MWDVFTFDPRKQEWNAVKELVALKGRCPGTTAFAAGPDRQLAKFEYGRWDCVRLIRSTVDATRDFAAAYALGSLHYVAFLRKMERLSSTPLLRAVRLRVDEDDTLCVHVARHNEPDSVEHYIVYRRTDMHEACSGVARDLPAVVDKRDLSDWMNCFTHYSLEMSSYQLAIVISGFSEHAKGLIDCFHVHTNSDGENPVGSTVNGGRSAFLRFANQHRCNDFCKQLRLPPIRK